MKKDLERLKCKKKINRNIQRSGGKLYVGVFKSNTCMYCYLFDNVKKKMIATISSNCLNKNKKNCNIIDAKNTGVKMGEKLKEMKIKSVVFNRSGYVFHGKVEALANGIKSVGIKI